MSAQHFMPILKNLNDTHFHTDEGLMVVRFFTLFMDLEKTV